MSASVGYTLKGLDVSLSHAAHRRSSFNDPIVLARWAQGEMEYARLAGDGDGHGDDDKDQRAVEGGIVERWMALQAGEGKEKGPGKVG